MYCTSTTSYSLTPPVGSESFGINYLRATQFEFQLDDTPFDERLSLLCRVIFGIFRQIALRSRFGDGVDHLRTLYRLEVMQLLAQQLSASQSQWYFAHSGTFLVVSR